MSLKKEYRNLEMKVLSTVRDMIMKSHTDGPFPYIDIEYNGYEQLAVVNDRVCIIHDGYQYSVPNNDCTLEDLIDIIESNPQE